jgi:phosphate/sulfate permease
MDFNTICLYLFAGVVGFLIASFIFSLLPKKVESTEKTDRVGVFAIALWVKDSETPFMIAFANEIDRDKTFDALKVAIDAGQATYAFSNNIDGTYCFSVLKYITAVHKTNS